MKNILNIIEIPSEIGAGTRGASLGIDAMKAVARAKNNLFFSQHHCVRIPNNNSCLDYPNATPTAKNIGNYRLVFNRIAQEVKQSAKKSKNPLVVLSGDHANAAAVIAGIKEAKPKKKIGVIWIDAHADLHSPYTSPSGNMHGMPLAISIGEDNLPAKQKAPLTSTINIWEELKNHGGIQPKVAPEHLFFVGVRDADPPEALLMSDFKMPNVMVKELKEIGIEGVVQKAKMYLSDCDHIYISFDVDSMDPVKVSDGTGTPVKNGLSLKQAKDLIQGLLNAFDNICCFEITEINPLLDSKKNRMAEAAFEVLEEVSHTILNK